MKDWTSYFLDIAKEVSSRSNCLRAEVGAIIVSPDNRIVSTGYNGVPSGVKSCIDRNFCYRIDKNVPSGTRYETCRSIHAEQNAIIQIGRVGCVDGTMYVYGHSDICILCKRFIINSGIKAVILQDNQEFISRIFVKDWIEEL